jgi:hypothetical protein
LPKFWLLPAAVVVDTPHLEQVPAAAAVLVDIAQMQHFRCLHRLQLQWGQVVTQALHPHPVALPF